MGKIKKAHRAHKKGTQHTGQAHRAGTRKEGYKLYTHVLTCSS